MKQFAIVITLCLLGQAALATEPSSVTESDDEYSPGLAVALTLGPAAAMVGTGLGLYFGGVSEDVSWLGLGLVVAGMTFGPSIGHMYTGDWGRAGLFTLGRALGMGAIIGGFVGSFGLMYSSSTAGSEGLAMLGVGGLALTVGLTVWEAYDARACALQNNNRRTLTLAPLVLPPAPSANQPSAIGVGMGLSGAF